MPIYEQSVERKENESCMVVRHLVNLSTLHCNCCWAYCLQNCWNQQSLV